MIFINEHIALCGNSVCDFDNGEDCLTCTADCGAIDKSCGNIYIHYPLFGSLLLIRK